MSEETKSSVIIGMPSYGYVPATMLSYFSELIARSVTDGLTTDFIQEHGAYIDDARNGIVKKALSNKGTTHVLFVDQDMKLPPDTVSRLLSHNVDVVGGLYFMKLPPFQPVAFNLPCELLNEYPENQLMQVGGTGMGCTLIKTDVFVRMSEAFGDDNWFKLGQGVGEDIWFAQRCAELGIPFYLDTSLKCGHLGESVFTEESRQRFLSRAFAYKTSKGGFSMNDTEVKEESSPDTIAIPELFRYMLEAAYNEIHIKQLEARLQNEEIIKATNKYNIIVDKLAKEVGIDPAGYSLDRNTWTLTKDK